MCHSFYYWVVEEACHSRIHKGVDIGRLHGKNSKCSHGTCGPSLRFSTAWRRQLTPCSRRAPHTFTLRTRLWPLSVVFAHEYEARTERYWKCMNLSTSDHRIFDSGLQCWGTGRRASRIAFLSLNSSPANLIWLKYWNGVLNAICVHLLGQDFLKSCQRTFSSIVQDRWGQCELKHIKTVSILYIYIKTTHLVHNVLVVHGCISITCQPKAAKQGSLSLTMSKPRRIHTERPPELPVSQVPNGPSSAPICFATKALLELTHQLTRQKYEQSASLRRQELVQNTHCKNQGKWHDSCGRLWMKSLTPGWVLLNTEEENPAHNFHDCQKPLMKFRSCDCVKARKAMPVLSPG